MPSTPTLSTRQTIGMFLAFAMAYFCSTLVRAITATLAPTLSAEFGLNARDLGLLAGGYFIGFAAMQLPLGFWLDRYGPRRVILGFLSIAVLACWAFALAHSFGALLLARMLCGVGVCACLMAPLTAYRRWFGADMQTRANSWMLMSGSLGMLASTLPVQWLMPHIGWRGVFVLLGVLLLLVMLVLYFQVPIWRSDSSPDNKSSESKALQASDPSAGPSTPTTPTRPRAARALLADYGPILKHPYFRRLGPLGFFNYGGVIAIQTLWAGPWLQKVAGYSTNESATALFWLNLAMLGTFWLWGWVTPRWTQRGISADSIMAWGLPLSLICLAVNVSLGSDCGAWGWILFCVSSSVVALTQPSVGMAFDTSLAGRALSAYNLVLFSGVFTVQWGIGLMIDGWLALGQDLITAYRLALAVFGLASLWAYLHFLWPQLKIRRQIA